MIFSQQSRFYIDRIRTRKRSPVRQATVRIYQSYLDAHILPILGLKSIECIENGMMRTFIADLEHKNLAPTTVNQIFNLVTAVISSYTDENGNEVCPRKWNHDFIDLPVVKPTNGRIVTPEQVTGAVLSASGQLQAMLVLLTASGVRIGELLALQGHLTTNPEPIMCSYWDPKNSILRIRSTLVRGKIEPQPKTDAGNREIDLHFEINDFLKDCKLPEEGFLFQNSLGDRARVETLYNQLEDLGLDTGFHAFRRFRATYLESQNVPRSLTSYWLGHHSNHITDRYIKIGQNLEIRKEWALKAGYGFKL